jgi:hypothetical protein
MLPMNPLLFRPAKEQQHTDIDEYDESCKPKEDRCTVANQNYRGEEDEQYTKQPLGKIVQVKYFFEVLYKKGYTLLSLLEILRELCC